MAVTLACLGGRAGAETLAEAVALAVYGNPEIGQAQANRNAIDFELRQARGLYLPQIDLEASIGPEWTDRGSIDSEVLLRRELSIVLQQMIFDGFATDAEVERQAARVDAAAYRVFERSEFIGLDAVQAYLDILRQTELVELARENIVVHQETLANVQQRANAGQSSIADVQQTQERLQAAEATLVELQSGLEEARITYQRITGQPPGPLVRPVTIAAVLPGSMEAAIGQALTANPTMSLAIADLDTSYADFKAANANFYPTLDLEASATAGWDIGGTEGEGHSAQALLVLRYNLFRGGIDTANREEQVRRIDEARQRLLGVERNVEELVRQTYNQLNTATARLALLQAQAVLSEQVRESYRQQFTIGARTLLDVLDAENELFNVRVQLATTAYAEEFARYRIMASMGSLLSTLGIEPPPEAIANRRAGAGVPPTPESETMHRSVLDYTPAP